MNKYKLLRYVYPMIYGGLYGGMVTYYTDYGIIESIIIVLPYIIINAYFSIYLLDEITKHKGVTNELCR